MSKTLRKFSKKGKKTQYRRKTKGKKYGGNDSCTIGNVKVKELTPGDGPNCASLFTVSFFVPYQYQTSGIIYDTSLVLSFHHIHTNLH